MLESEKKILEESLNKVQTEKAILDNEHKEVNLQCKNLQSKIKHWIAKTEMDSTIIKDLDKKVKQVSTEKRDFELLLTRYEHSLSLGYMLQYKMWKHKN